MHRTLCIEYSVYMLLCNAVKKHNVNTGLLIEHIKINRHDGEEVISIERWHHDL